jgi:hypothetical protein
LAHCAHNRLRIRISSAHFFEKKLPVNNIPPCSIGRILEKDGLLAAFLKAPIREFRAQKELLGGRPKIVEL